jgi:hypothetical protein
MKLDRTEQRLVGVLIEKQRTVPDTYPMTENALVLGCNQKNNRDPLTELQTFEVRGALMALQEKGVVAQVFGAGRVPKFRHKLDEVLGLSSDELAVLCELLVRGPQAPGALKPRVARFECHRTPEQLDELLQQMAARSPALVELLPLAPRERDRRWRHLLGDGSELVAGGERGASAPASVTAPRAVTADVDDRGPLAVLQQRVDRLETELQELRQQVARLQSAPPPR